MQCIKMKSGRGLYCSITIELIRKTSDTDRQCVRLLANMTFCLLQPLGYLAVSASLTLYSIEFYCIVCLLAVLNHSIYKIIDDK